MSIENFQFQIGDVVKLYPMQKYKTARPQYAEVTDTMIDNRGKQWLNLYNLGFKDADACEIILRNDETHHRNVCKACQESNQ